MTISTSFFQPTEYNGNGATVAFSFTFPFFAQTDIFIALYDNTAKALVSPQPVLNGAGTYDYTIANSPDPNTGESAGGTITFNNAPLSNHRLDIIRNTADTQPNVFTSNAKMPAKTIESSLDRATLIVQEANFSASRSLQIPYSDPNSTGTTLPDFNARASKGLFFGTSGQPVVGNYTQSQTEAAISAVLNGSQTPGLSAPVYTQATLPGSGIVVPSIAFCSDLAGDAGGLVWWDGSVWHRVAEKGHLKDTTTLTGTINQTILGSAVTTRFLGSLSGNVTINLPAAGLYTGARKRSIFAGTLNAHTFTVNGKSLAVNQFYEAEYDGTAWVETAGGTLL